MANASGAPSAPPGAVLRRCRCSGDVDGERFVPRAGRAALYAASTWGTSIMRPPPTARVEEESVREANLYRRFGAAVSLNAALLRRMRSPSACLIPPAPRHARRARLERGHYRRVGGRVDRREEPQCRKSVPGFTTSTRPRRHYSTSESARERGGRCNDIGSQCCPCRTIAGREANVAPMAAAGCCTGSNAAAATDANPPVTKPSSSAQPRWRSLASSRRN